MKKGFLSVLFLSLFCHNFCCYAMEQKLDDLPVKQIDLKQPANKNNQPPKSWISSSYELIDPTTPKEKRTFVQKVSRHLWVNYTQEGQKHITGIADQNGQQETEELFLLLKKDIECGQENIETDNKAKRRIDACHKLAKLLCARLTTPPFERADIDDATKLLNLRSKDSLTHDLVEQLTEKTLFAIDALTKELIKNREIVAKIQHTNQREDL